MPCVYILRSTVSIRYYIGSSRDDTANTRLSKHNTGGVRSTKYGVPWIMLHCEEFVNYTEARKREIFLKSGAGRKWIKENFS